MIAPATRSERIAGDGVTLSVDRAGDGPPVLLLHGFPENRMSWRHQVGPLAAAGFDAIAPDLRGYGRSDHPAGREAYRLERLVADVAALVNATGHERAHVVGHDWGGIVAWAFAAAHPDRIGRLAILNAPHLGRYLEEVRRPPQALKSWYVLFFQLPGLPERVLSARDFRAVRTALRRTPARPAFTEADIDAYVAALAAPGALIAALNYYRANFPGTPAWARGRVEAESLVLWGERDPSLSPRLLDGLERFVPRVRVHRFPEAGHWLQNERPDEVNRRLIEFLRDGT